MNTNLLIKKVENAYINLKNNDFSGCYFWWMDNYKYAIVLGNTDDGIGIKLAYNCDDLQCDYDFDWFLPMIDDEIDSACEFIVDNFYDISFYVESLLSSYNSFYKYK